MSQPKLTLRPPPNVDFVQGYPGIPPGPDRLQAAVKGAIEVRVGPQGVKAKWVRIELRKVETLPGGGVANTFFDFVGQSPVSLWQAPSDEYGILHTNDYPFFIRIPESIPPTIALEKGAGIKYELIASVCVQGKKGFLRRDKPTITATASPIVIDKHELHSTWPIYSQPETRTHSQDGVTLIVERAHTCYGPGDRVVVMATVKSETLHTVMLRGFEFMLRETTVLRASAHTVGKKGSPQVKVSSIGEQNVPVNATLYGGTQHRAELSVMVPPYHTSATINSARHIDINYVLTVKALMSTGQPIVMDLPVMISNWPRAVSTEAMRRIGHAFNVSLPAGHPGNAQQVQSPPAQQPTMIGKPGGVSPTNGSSHGNSDSIDKKPSITEFRAINKGAQFNTAPAVANNIDGFAPDEFGGRKRSVELNGPPFVAQTVGAAARVRASSGTSSSDGGGGQFAPVSAARPRSSNGRGGNSAQRLTIANISEEEMKEHMEAEAEFARRMPSTILESPVAMSPPERLGVAAKPPSSAPQLQKNPSGLASGWVSAEKEKELLYQRAVANVERVQGLARTSVDQHGLQNGHGDTGSIKSPTPTGSKVLWPSAEEEKTRLFNQAQAAVARARGLESPDFAGTSSVTTGSPSSSGRVTSISAGAALYQEAMTAINKPVTSPGPVTPASIASPTPVRQSTPSALPSAADEKAMLQRYYQAKNAVFQTQSAHYGRVPGNAEPTPYDALYPNQQPTSPTPSNAYLPPPVQSPPVSPDMPPSFAAASGSSQHPILSEKERLRRHFEAQDAAAAQSQQQPWQPSPPQDPYGSPPPNPYASSPGVPDPRYSAPVSARNPPPFSPTQAGPMSAFEEKEMLRRRYEQQDTGAASGVPPTPPPRSSQMTGTGGRGRPPPTPPISPNGVIAPISGRPLTAVEEKARLKAMFEAEERATDTLPAPPSAHSPYPSPPPSNGYHDQEPAPYSAVTPLSPSPQHPPAFDLMNIPPPPPLAPKPPKEYIEETRAEDMRTAAKLQAIDADPVRALEVDSDLASLAASEDEDAAGEPSSADTDARENTFGPGALSVLSELGSAVEQAAQGSASPRLARSPSAGPSGSVSYHSVPLSVPAPPPLPPKVLIE